jgi:hypothetical protein
MSTLHCISSVPSPFDPSLEAEDVVRDWRHHLGKENALMRPRCGNADIDILYRNINNQSTYERHMPPSRSLPLAFLISACACSITSFSASENV